MPTRTPASLSPMSSESAATPAQQIGVSRHIAFVQCLTPSSNSHDTLWLTACYRLTPYLQRLTLTSALLDLGSCTEAEAVDVVQALSDQLHSAQVSVQVAVGPTAILAQLALLRPAVDQGVTLISQESSANLLQTLPVAALKRLRLGDGSLLSPSALAALDGYGIRTLAQLAHLGEDRLRQQFGARLGTTLAAIARGEDLLPLQLTPSPERLHLRLRLSTPVPADHLLLRLPHFTAEIAAKLARRGLQARTIALRLRWESGTVQTLSRVLPTPLAESRSFDDLLHRLLAPLVQEQPESQRKVDDLRIILADLTPRYPAQHSFWPQRAKRLTTAYEIADVLARRHGKPLLFHARHTQPDAIFELERTCLAPVDAEMASEQNHPGSGTARPKAVDVANDAVIPHGVHWW